MEHHYDHDLLDAFAIAALAALIAEPEWPGLQGHSPLSTLLDPGLSHGGLAAGYAYAAYELAEAMMAESASRPKGGR